MSDTTKSLDRRLADIRTNPNSTEFIIADAKDADMAFGLAAPGPEKNGRHPSLQDFRQQIREIVEQGIVDIMLMSASTNDVLALDEQIFADSSVTPAARANDTTDIWSPQKGHYADQPSRPFRSATIDHIQCGRWECPPDQRCTGTDLGLYSMTFNNDLERDHATLQAFKEFRIEAEEKGFRYILEVFAPNVPGAVHSDVVGRFVNDLIVRALAGVTKAGRPIFLKMPYFGPGPLEELVAYDSTLTVGILGGASGTTLESFTLLADAKKHGARAALFGRRINNAENQLLFIEQLRHIADADTTPEEAVKAYEAGL